MTRRRALIGFTEAELGFVIAAVVAFTATAEMNAEKVPTPSPVAAVPETVFIERPAVVAADTPVVAEKARAQWASNLFRRGCAEVEGVTLPRVPVGVIDVEGINRYRLGGRSLSLRDLEVVLAPFDSGAKANRCRYTLLFRPSANVGASELLRAEEPFSGRFYREHRLR